MRGQAGRASGGPPLALLSDSCGRHHGGQRRRPAARRRPGRSPGPAGHRYRPNPGFLPVIPRNAVPDGVPGVIEGHQGLISPFLTRDRKAGADYGSICSIYSVRFAVSDAAVALLTRDHGPSATGTFTSSGTEPEFCASTAQNSHNDETGPDIPVRTDAAEENLRLATSRFAAAGPTRLTIRPAPRSEPRAG